jgi:hypothetical protein
MLEKNRFCGSMVFVFKIDVNKIPELFAKITDSRSFSYLTRTTKHQRLATFFVAPFLQREINFPMKIFHIPLIKNEAKLDDFF